MNNELFNLSTNLKESDHKRVERVERLLRDADNRPFLDHFESLHIQLHFEKVGLVLHNTYKGQCFLISPLGIYTYAWDNKLMRVVNYKRQSADTTSTDFLKDGPRALMHTIYNKPPSVQPNQFLIELIKLLNKAYDLRKKI